MIAFTFEQYQSKAVRSASEAATVELRICCWALGVAGESGEVADLIKKKLFHDHPIEAEQIGDEIGDVLWYLAVLCEELGLDLNEVAIQNLNKLRKRYPNGFSVEDSLMHRDNDAEFAAKMLKMRGGKLEEFDEETMRLVHALREAQKTLQNIQGSRKASIGSLHNTYSPQLNRANLDATADRIHAALIPYMKVV